MLGSCSQRTELVWLALRPSGRRLPPGDPGDRRTGPETSGGGRPPRAHRRAACPPHRPPPSCRAFVKVIGDLNNGQLQVPFGSAHRPQWTQLVPPGLLKPFSQNPLGFWILLSPFPPPSPTSASVSSAGSSSRPHCLCWGTPGPSPPALPPREISSSLTLVNQTPPTFPSAATASPPAAGLGQPSLPM